jgi:hypothetical protein
MQRIPQLMPTIKRKCGGERHQQRQAGVAIIAGLTWSWRTTCVPDDLLAAGAQPSGQHRCQVDLADAGRPPDQRQAIAPQPHNIEI